MGKKKKSYYILIPACLVLLVGAIILFGLKQHASGGLLLTGFWLALALLVVQTTKFSKFSYTVSILAAVTISLSFPEYFISIGGFPLGKLIVPLLQLITFGVGCTMSWKDLAGVLKMPKAVVVGIVCHYTIMPLVAYSIANTFNFPAEIAAGVILVGCMPSGLASNVIAFIAKANLALSVTLTAVSTLLAPLMTPLLMKSLGGQFVNVNFVDMFLDVIMMVILPIALGVLVNHFFRKYALWINKIMPKVSMVGVALIIVVITAAGSGSLLQVGLLLVFAMFLHMALGLMFGYWGAKLLGLTENDCRTVGIEVGMQNGGLASGIAASMGKIATVGLASAVNGPIMNTFFSLIATWWGGKKIQDKARR